MFNLKELFEDSLPLTPRFLVNTLKGLCNKIIVNKSVLDEIALMPSNGDITSLISVEELTEIARCIKTRGTILIEDDTDPTLAGGHYAPISMFAIFNEDVDVSAAIAWIEWSGSSVIYHHLEMYVKYSTNQVILSNASYKIL